MRKLKSPIVLFDGDHFKVEYKKRAYAENKVEIIHIIEKRLGVKYEFYSSNYAIQIENNVTPSITSSTIHITKSNTGNR